MPDPWSSPAEPRYVDHVSAATADEEAGGFQGAGCAISTASASVMTESLKGKTLAEAEALFTIFHDLVTGKPPASGKAPELGKLAVFSGVSEFPARVKCATLAWHTLHAILQGTGETVSTE